MEQEQILENMKELKYNIENCRIINSKILGDNVNIQNSKIINTNISVGKQEPSISDSTDNKIINVQDIVFYGQIKIMNPDTKQEESKNIYRIEQYVEGKRKIEFYADNEIIAIVLDGENELVISPKYEHVISVEIFLIKMEELQEQNREPISLEKLEEIERERQIGAGIKNKKTTEKEVAKEDKDNEKEQEDTLEKRQYNKSYVEISMDKYITANKKIADIIPEAKQKHCQSIRIRSGNNINFEVYGVDNNGNEVQLETLGQTEGTNPNQEIMRVKRDGTVERYRASTMLKIQSGSNEQMGNEGLSIKMGSMGKPEVDYWRRDKNDNYLSFPVILENTNEKYTPKEIREMATKRYNSGIDDNIERAKERLEYDDQTIIQNMDDNLTNNIIDETEMELIKQAAEQRCGGMSIGAFLKIYEQTQGDTIQERIDETVEEVDEQFREK